MKRNITLIVLIIAGLFSTTPVVFAQTLRNQAQEYLERTCTTSVKGFNAVLCSFNQRIAVLEENTLGRHVLADYGQVRGSFWETDPTPENVQTPDSVSVNCTRNCVLWVSYDVDTRNTTTEGAPPPGFQHLYHLYLDSVDQAVFNQASMSVVNAAIPLAVNGVFEVGPGEHTIDVYVRATGGHLQQYESHLQVLAFQ